MDGMNVNEEGPRVSFQKGLKESHHDNHETDHSGGVDTSRGRSDSSSSSSSSSSISIGS